MTMSAVSQYFYDLGWRKFPESLYTDKSLKLSEFLQKEREFYRVNPPSNLVFNALMGMRPEDVKVVILGQDPYPEPGVANGLAFATAKDKRPQSLRNIFREIEFDLQKNMEHATNDLIGWKNQGVLLLNTCLTCRAGQPNSHKGKGWEEITSAIIQDVSNVKQKKVFLLWGNHAKSYTKYIKRDEFNFMLESGHPSPLSVKSFYGCKHFSKTNEILENVIDWTKTGVEIDIIDLIDELSR